jgi:hypothetical protein
MTDRGEPLRHLSCFFPRKVDITGQLEGSLTPLTTYGNYIIYE